MENKLGRENTVKLILMLAIPAMLAQLINVLYTIVDRIYIANLKNIGDYALTGIGISAPLCAIITSFPYLVGIGGAPLMSMSLGENRSDNAHKILANAFLMLAVIGIIVPLCILCIYHPSLYLFGATNNTYKYARNYLLVYLIGAPFAIMAVGLNQFLISMGHSSKGMITMVLGAIVNIILDPIFIFVFDMDVIGAAIATDISQIISFIFVFSMLMSKKHEVTIKFKGYDKYIIKRILRLGICPFLIQATDSICVLFMNMSIKMYAKKDLIDSYILVATIVASFYQLFSMPLLGLSGGTEGYLSYNYGARKTKRVIKGFMTTVSFGLIFTSMCVILSFFIKKPFVNFYTDDPFVRKETCKMITFYMISFIPLTFQYTLIDGLTALGKTNIGIFLSLDRKITSIIFSLTLPLFLGINGSFLQATVSDIWASVVTTIVFMLVIGKILKKREESKETVI